MNNKGFTLVELLAVLVILSLLITVAVPSVNKIMLNINEDMYCEKVTNIENTARLYAEDYYMDQIAIDEKIIEDNIPLSILIEKSYLSKDEETCSLGSDDNPCIIDPCDDTGMDNLTFRVYTKNRRIYASVNFDKSMCE